VEKPEVAEVRACLRKSAWRAENVSEFILRRGCSIWNLVFPPPTEVRHQSDPPFGDFCIRPTRNDIRPNREEEMDVVSHDRERDDIDRHEVREELEAIDNPLPSRWILKERLPTDAPRHAVIHAGIAGIDDVTTTTCHAAESSGAQGSASKFGTFSDDSDHFWSLGQACTEEVLDTEFGTEFGTGMR
jgi:hypothetical protein